MVGIFDWQLASFGPREMDLTWYLAMEKLTTHMVKSSVPGFRDAQEFVAAYEQCSGHAVHDLDWHLIFASLVLPPLTIGKLAWPSERRSASQVPTATATRYCVQLGVGSTSSYVVNRFIMFDLGPRIDGICATAMIRNDIQRFSWCVTGVVHPSASTPGIALRSAPPQCHSD